jgi:hypothetical protein
MCSSLNTDLNIDLNLGPKISVVIYKKIFKLYPNKLCSQTRL